MLWEFDNLIRLAVFQSCLNCKIHWYRVLLILLTTATSIFSIREFRDQVNFTYHEKSSYCLMACSRHSFIPECSDATDKGLAWEAKLTTLNWLLWGWPSLPFRPAGTTLASRWCSRALLCGSSRRRQRQTKELFETMNNEYLVLDGVNFLINQFFTKFVVSCKSFKAICAKVFTRWCCHICSAI